MTCRFVLTDEPISCRAIKYRHYFFERSLGSRLIGSSDRSDSSLEMGSHHRTTAGVCLAALFGLVRTLSRRCCVGQGMLLDSDLKNEARIIFTAAGAVNPK